MNIDKMVIYSDSIEQFDYNGPNFARCDSCGAVLDIGIEETWPHEWITDERCEHEYYTCPECHSPLPDYPSPYDICDWLHDTGASIEHVLDSDGLYAGSIVHHETPTPDNPIPHVWTDTRTKRTYIEFQSGDIECIPTSCNALDEYCGYLYSERDASFGKEPDRAGFIRDEWIETTRDVLARTDETIGILETLIADAQDSIERIKVDRREYERLSAFGFAKEHRQREHLVCSLHFASSRIGRASDRIESRYENVDTIGDKLDLLASIITKLSGND